MTCTLRQLAPRTLAGRLFLLTLAALLLATLAACGGSEPATPTPTEAAVVEAPTPTLITASDIAVTGPTAPTAPTLTPVGEQPVYGGTARVGSLGPIFLSPDPYHVRSTSTKGFRAVYNSLVQLKFPYDEARGPEHVPALATEWSQSQDGSKWTLKLRQGVTWHDGEVFNADDVVATFERTLDRDLLIIVRQALIRNIFTGGVKKVDDYTVVLDTREPNATAFPWVANHSIMMMPEHLIRGDRNATDPKLRWKFMNPDKTIPENTGTLAVGTGPFIMKKWDPEVETVWERNPNFWERDEHGNRLPYLDRIEAKTIPDPTRLNANFVAGNLSLGLGTGTGLHPKNAKSFCQITKQPGCYVSAWYPHGSFEWWLNPGKVDPFKNQKVVQAARYASDHQKSIDLAYGRGQGFMWMDRVRFPEAALTVKEQYEVLPWSNPARRGEFEQKAKDLLGEAGYPSGIDLPLPIFGSCSGVFLDKFSREVDQFHRVGIRGFLECRAGIIQNDEIKAGRWSLADSPANIFIIDPGTMVFSKLLLDSPALAANRFPYEGQEAVDAKFRQIVREIDQAKRNEGYRALERHLANDKLTVWSLGYTYVVAAVHGCVHNLKPGGIWESHFHALNYAWVTPDCK